MADPLTRQQIRRGLLKSEEVHGLAQQVAYGKQRRLTARDLQAPKNTSSCLTLIRACIIYWQAKEINQVILEGQPEANGINLSLLELNSPTGWETVVIYGEYVLNRSSVKARVCRFVAPLFQVFTRKWEIPFERLMGRQSLQACQLARRFDDGFHRHPSSPSSPAPPTSPSFTKLTCCSP